MFSRNGKSEAVVTKNAREPPLECAQVPLRYHEEISALWAQAEQLLEKYGYPYPVRHCYECSGSAEDGDRKGKALVWDKKKKSESSGPSDSAERWHVLLEQFDEDDYWYGVCRTPITHTDIATQLEAMQHFEALRDRVVNECENVVPRLDKALSEFRFVLTRERSHED
jgi:hypothetical protein